MPEMRWFQVWAGTRGENKQHRYRLRPENKLSLMIHLSQVGVNRSDCCG